MAINQSQKIQKVPCNHCNHETKHAVLQVINKEDCKTIRLSSPPYSKEDTVFWRTTYTLLQCCGCDTVTLREKVEFSEYEDWEQELPKYYPPRTYRQLPRWAKEHPEADALPKDVQELLTEVYAALWSDNRRLATMGTRTLIDMFAIDKLECDIGSFQQKLQALVDNKYIGEKQRAILDNALQAGNAVVHRSFKPDIKDLHHVMEIVENLLHFYITEKASSELEPRVPKKRN